MANTGKSQVITANRLLAGDVVYMSLDGGWTPDLTNARILCDQSEVLPLLEIAQTQENSVVGAYAFDVSDERATPSPTHFRENIRTKGPSNYFHGKQAEV